MRPIKLTIVGYLFQGVVYKTKEAWQYAKDQFNKAKNQSLLAKAIRAIVKEDKVKDAKEALKKFGYSFKRWVSLAKAKAEYVAFIVGLTKSERMQILN
jgi:hypothetical protein